MRFAFVFLLVFLLAFLFACNGQNSTGPVNGSTSSTSGNSNTGNTSANAADTNDGSDSDSTDPAIESILDSEELAFLTLINDYRAQNGLGKLELSLDLCQASSWMSQDMATKAYLDHTDSQGRSFSTRITSFGYTASSTIGENIAYGHELAKDTFEQWKNSPAHNANMLSSYYKVIGIGRYNYSGTSWGWYWTTDFGGKVD